MSLGNIKFIDKYGKEMSKEDWYEIFEDIEYRRVGLDTVGDVQISTVWLGIEHANGTFETMIFGDDVDDIVERYWTLERAEEGHAKYVRWYREKLGEEQDETIEI